MPPGPTGGSDTAASLTSLGPPSVTSTRSSRLGSVTTSVSILVGGIALMILPSLIVGNELLILGGVGAAVGVWFFAHRHGQLRGLVDAAKADLAAPPANSGKTGGT